MKLHATGKDLIIKESDRFISGSRNIYSCEFTFDSCWDGYIVTAVFSTGNKMINVPVVDGKCDVPHDVLRPNAKIRIGIFGIDGERTMPTTYSDWIIVEQGTDATGTPARPPSPTIYEQWMGVLDAKNDEWEENEKARQEAEIIRQDKELGYIAQAKAAARRAEDARDIAESVVGGDYASTAYVRLRDDMHNADEEAHADIRAAIESKADAGSAIPLIEANSTSFDMDVIIKSGSHYSAYRVGTYTKGTPYHKGLIGYAYGIVFSVAPSEASGEQFAIISGAPCVYHRRQVNGNTEDWHLLYSAGNKPTAADVGALPTTGGTLTGSLTLERSTLPDLFLAQTTEGTAVSLRNQGTAAELGIRNESGSINNLRSLYLRNSKNTATLDRAIQLRDVVYDEEKKEAVSTYYKILHEGNSESVGVSRIASFSYVGSGSEGAAGQNELTFSFAPKYLQIVAIKLANGTDYDSPGILPILCCTVLTTEYQAVAFKYQSTDANRKTYAKKSADGKTISWYHATEPLAQFNGSGVTYYGIAIG